MLGEKGDKWRIVHCPKKIIFGIYSPLGLIQVDSRSKRALDEVLVTWTVSFGGWLGFSSFHQAGPVLEHFCAFTMASQSALTHLQN